MSCFNMNNIFKKSICQTAVCLALASMGMTAQAQSSLQPQELNVDGTIDVKRADAAVGKTNTNSITSPSRIADALMLTARQKNLATHPTWLRLHYYDDKTYQSQVDNPSFFVSPDGRDDPQAELDAFIKETVFAAFDNKKAGADSLSCRFPARMHWLKAQLGLQDGNVACPTFDTWFAKLDPQRLSVVFAEEYPDRPVSAFGHTLMLIDSSASLADPTAVDKAHALNDTVGGDADDPFVLYALKSTFGSYPNDITIEPYPVKLAEYLQDDNRDVWTYGLNLTQAEVQQIMRHVWETKDLALPYYFTTDNCASEILRYIDVVRPEGSLLDTFNVAIVPTDVIKLLHKQGLIDKQSYLPADKTLTQGERNNPQFTNLPESSLTDTNKLALTPLKPADNNVLDAHKRQRIVIGAGNQGDTGYLSLAYRGGFNAPLDRPSGYPQNLYLEAGIVELRVYEDDDTPNSNRERVELQELTLLRGRSFNPRNTARHGESALASWGINLQGVRVKDGSEDTVIDSHFVGNAAYEKGVSMAFGTPTAGTGELPPHLCYAMGAGMAQVGKGLNNGYRIGVGANLGCRYHFNKQARITGELKLPYWYHGDIEADNTHDGYLQPMLSLGAQYGFNKNQAIRIQGSYQMLDRIESEEDISIAYVHYF